MSYDPDARFDGDAWIPSLEPYGLARVPGHDDLNPHWREEWRDWREKVLALGARLDAKARADPAFARAEYAICKQDVAYFCAIYCWLEEPRIREGEEVVKRFVPFAVQVKLLQQFVAEASSPRKSDIYISKARGFGISWIVCVFALWGWLFRDWRGKLVSYKEEKVWKPLDLDALFSKIDFLLLYLPQWAIPAGFDRDEHFQKNVLRRPDRKAQLSGESTTARTARGGRATYIIYDEAAFVEGWDDVYGTGGGSTDHRVALSTESFEQGFAWRNTWTTARDRRPDLVHEIDWWLNPYYDERWLEEERARYASRPEVFEVEYLRNPWAYSDQWVYPMAREMPELEVGYDPTKLLLVGIDPGHNDDTALVWGQLASRDGNRGVHWLDCYERNFVPVEWFAHLLTGVEPEPGDECAKFRLLPREREIMAFFRDLPAGGDRVRFYMDPAGAAKHNGISFWELLVKKSAQLRKRAGLADGKPIVPLHRALQGKGNLLDERRYATRPILTHSTVERNEGGKRIKEALANYKFAEPTEKATSEPKPIHNHHSHVATAVEYTCSYIKIGLADPPKPLSERTRRAARKVA